MFCMRLGLSLICCINDCMPGDENKDPPVIVGLLDEDEVVVVVVLDEVDDVVLADPPQGFGIGALDSPDCC